MIFFSFKLTIDWPQIGRKSVIYVYDINTQLLDIHPDLGILYEKTPAFLPLFPKRHKKATKKYIIFITMQVANNN